MYETSAYWSESQKQFVQVGEMPMPYAKNVFRKLMREDADTFVGSVLCKALMDRLMPSKAVLTTLLRTKGAAAYLTNPDDKKALAADKRMFQSIAKKIGVPVHTELNGDFLEATCEPIGEEAVIHIHHSPKKSFTRKGAE